MSSHVTACMQESQLPVTVFCYSAVMVEKDPLRTDVQWPSIRVGNRTWQGGSPLAPSCSQIFAWSEPPTMPTLTYCRQNVSLQQAACHASQQVGMLCRLQSPAICCHHVASAAGLHA